MVEAVVDPELFFWDGPAVGFYEVDLFLDEFEVGIVEGPGELDNSGPVFYVCHGGLPVVWKACGF